MPKNSVAVFFSAAQQNRSNDVNYHFHQNPDYFYLTGHKEAGGVLVLFSQKVVLYGQPTDELLFVMPLDPTAELWNGKRLGPQKAADTLGFELVKSNREFFNLPFSFSKFDKILFFEPKIDLRAATYQVQEADNMPALQMAFVKQAQIPELISSTLLDVYALIRKGNGAVLPQLEYLTKENPNFLTDYWIGQYQKASKDKDRQQIARLINESKFDLQTGNAILDKMRQIKTEEELILLRKAIDITVLAQNEAIKAIHPEMSELEIQGLHEFVYRRCGAAFEGYPSIVGSGHNGCVLHYTENSRKKIGDDLVLMDLGAEYEGYTADITRTVPGSGKFSPEQKQIYELVLAAQEEAFKACKVGQFFYAPHNKAKAVIAEGLLKLGIIQNKAQAVGYFPHGTSHFLGLDVHDRGIPAVLEKGMVITVEPGIYIAPGSPCDPKWWGIAVRIEDDVLINESGCEILSVGAPRKVAEIEKLMAEPSPLLQWKLPKMD
jgi:Xaa-Pro aminopeptidase